MAWGATGSEARDENVTGLFSVCVGGAADGFRSGATTRAVQEGQRVGGRGPDGGEDLGGAAAGRIRARAGTRSEC